MITSRPIMLSVTLLPLAAYGLGIWSEVARNTVGLGFNERFGVGRLADGFGKVTWQELGKFRFESWEYLMVVGMVALLVAAVMGMKRIYRWIPAAYLAMLLGLGGGVGLVMVIYFPILMYNLVSEPLPMDGELFADQLARYMMAGIWLVLLLVWSLMACITWRPAWMTESGNHTHV
jgi:hypothetical protein